MPNESSSSSNAKSSSGSRSLPPSRELSQKKPLVLGRRLKSPADIKTLPELRRYFHIGAWDAIVITDGSGTGWEHAIGWGAAVIEKGKIGLQLRSGAASHGTNNVAEIMAAFMPLFEFAEAEYGQRPDGFLVHVISDSQYVVSALAGVEEGGAEWAMGYSANRSLWLAVLGAVRKGIRIKAHYVPRGLLNFNKLCHDLANASRKRQAAVGEDLAAKGWDPSSLMED